MKSIILASLSFVGLCLLNLRMAKAQEADAFFHKGARHYLATNEFALAKTTVSNGLTLHPEDPKLKKLWELLNQQQQQQQQQDKQDKKDQEKKQEQSKQDQESKEQQSKEQQKKEEQAK